MRIAYYSNYVGREFAAKYCEGVKYAISGPLKTQGIARALLSAGHEVHIFSSGITNCNAKIFAFSEDEVYPEGTLHVHYPNILSLRRRGPINDYRAHKLLARFDRVEKFDAYLYYNPYIGAAMNLRLFNNRLKILEYEDNVYNKYVAGAKNPFEQVRGRIYHYVLKRSDAAFAVCKGMFDDATIKHILTPGVINEDVTDAISNNIHQLKGGQPAKIIYTGGTGYDKGSDIIIRALQEIQHSCSVDFYTNGTFYGEAKTLLSEVPSRHQVTIKGYLPHKELMRVLSSEADILLSTTRSMGVAEQSAGFPFKIMEYAALGRPIVSSELAKLDDEFNQKMNYYHNDSPHELADVIDHVLDNYGESIKRAMDLQQLVLSRYSIKGLGNQLDSFLRSLNH